MSDTFDRLLATSERSFTVFRPEWVAAGGAALVVGGLALKTATLPYPTSNLGGYATAQSIVPSFMAGKDLSLFVKQLGGPVGAALAVGTVICGMGLLLGCLLDD